MNFVLQKITLRRFALALLCAGFLAPAAYAADKVKTPSTPAEAALRKSIEAVVGQDGVVSMRKAGYGNFYEILTGDGSMLYADASGAFLFTGQLIDLKARKNVTQARELELSRINFADLPLNQAIKQVRGNGKRTLVTFEDPNCGYCKKLAKDIVDLKDTTVYTFIIPILSPDSTEKGRNIWCAPDKVKAWNDWMVDGKSLATYSCDTPLAKNQDLANRFRIRGTPTMFLADGNRLGGYTPLAELDKAITAAEANAKK